MILLSALAICCLWMALLWLIQRFTGNAAVVDLGWTLSVPFLHFYFAWLGGGDLGRGLALAAMVCLWGLRLGGHLFWTRLRPGMPEEGRYQKLRDEWGDKFQSRLFLFYQAQALAAFALVAVFWPFYRDASPGLGWTQVLGSLLFALGFAGVSLADAQLAQFKKRSTHGGVCQDGLWNYSRHPNYFFETMLWFGWATFAGGGWSLLAPLTILHLVLNVTGIPPTEEQALRSKGDAYRDYQRTTSAFVPWFKKS
ncbi:DUF1295 domain-containing protein [bacterium]|nr:DUF1295 domain-containing protein [bacterium]